MTLKFKIFWVNQKHATRQKQSAFWRNDSCGLIIDSESKTCSVTSVFRFLNEWLLNFRSFEWIKNMQLYWSSLLLEGMTLVNWFLLVNQKHAVWPQCVSILEWITPIRQFFVVNKNTSVGAVIIWNKLKLIRLTNGMTSYYFP